MKAATSAAPRTRLTGTGESAPESCSHHPKVRPSIRAKTIPPIPSALSGTPSTSGRPLRSGSRVSTRYLWMPTRVSSPNGMLSQKAHRQRWRWAFWLNIPFGLLTLVGIHKYLVETRDPERKGRPDVLGVPLSALGIGGIVFALIEGRTFGWWLQDSGALSPVPVSLVLGAALVAAFIVLERRRAAAGKVVLIDLGLLRIRSFRFGVIAALVVAAGEFGMLFTLPLLLQGALGYTALGTGVVVLALAMGTFLVSGATPRLVDSMGGRSVVRLGLAIEAAAVAGLALTMSGTVSSW